ncbi:glycosyltransferase family 32 protein [Atractiella rhizophila]|nr:glycosyltransferase family 32 protein [Atractiella rhizophila]
MEEKVPNIFHSLFLTGGTGNGSSIEMKPDWIRADDECRRLHPEAKFMRWTDENATAFVGQYYPEIYDSYIGYKQNIQRSNILRYLVLHHYGGIYLDLDLMCRINLDHFRYTYDFVTPPAAPSGVNNAFIASAKGHPFWSFMIDHINYFNLPYPFPYLENMASTGCLFFTSIHLIAPSWIRNSMYVLPGKENRLRGRVVTPLFEHFGASSWHKGDAKVILMLGQTIENFSRSGGFRIVLFVLFLLVGSLAYLHFKRRLARGRRVKLGPDAVEEGRRVEEERDIMMEDYSLDESGSTGMSTSGGEEDEDQYSPRLKEDRKANAGWGGVWGMGNEKV